jgi:hypothetical protein
MDSPRVKLHLLIHPHKAYARVRMRTTTTTASCHRWGLPLRRSVVAPGSHHPTVVRSPRDVRQSPRARFESSVHRPEERRVNRVDRTILHVGQDVGVGVKGDAGLAVTESFAHCLDRGPGCQEQRRVGMAHTV